MTCHLVHPSSHLIQLPDQLKLSIGIQLLGILDCYLNESITSRSLWIGMLLKVKTGSKDLWVGLLALYETMYPLREEKTSNITEYKLFGWR